MTTTTRWAGLLLTVALAGCQSPTWRTAGVPAAPAPDATFVDLHGQRHHLSEFKGKPIVLTEWAAWCPHCQQQLPTIQNALCKRYGGQGVAFLAVEVSQGTIGSIGAFAQQHGMTMPLYVDADGSTQAAYPVTGYPTTVFISPDFRIVGSRMGEMPLSDYLAFLTPYLKAANPHPSR